MTLNAFAFWLSLFSLLIYLCTSGNYNSCFNNNKYSCAYRSCIKQCNIYYELHTVHFCFEYFAIPWIVSRKKWFEEESEFVSINFWLKKLDWTKMQQKLRFMYSVFLVLVWYFISVMYLSVDISASHAPEPNK